MIATGPSGRCDQPHIEYHGRYGQATLGDLFGLEHGWADDGTISRTAT
jgi:hypothetical protein